MGGEHWIWVSVTQKLLAIPTPSRFAFFTYSPKFRCSCYQLAQHLSLVNTTCAFGRGHWANCSSNFSDGYRRWGAFSVTSRVCQVQLLRLADAEKFISMITAHNNPGSSPSATCVLCDSQLRNITFTGKQPPVPLIHAWGFSNVFACTVLFLP